MWSRWKKAQENMETIPNITDSISRLAEQMDRLEEKLASFQEDHQQHENKLMRLQYKGTQEILENLENLKDSHRELPDLQQKLSMAEGQINLMFRCLLELLDDLDLVNSRLQAREDDDWKTLFQSWTDKILLAMERQGILEIPVLGQTFNPLHSEALGTRKRDEGEEEGAFPYQVVEVARRGFVTSEGSLIRKASVITIAEEQDHIGFVEMEPAGEPAPVQPAGEDGPPVESLRFTAGGRASKGFPLTLRKKSNHPRTKRPVLPWRNSGRGTGKTIQSGRL